MSEMTLQEAKDIAIKSERSDLPRGQALQVLLAEVNRLAELLEPKLIELHIKNNTVDMQIEGGILHFFAAHFAEYFRNCEGAENYIEMQAHSTDPEIGPLVLRLQRLHGKTPNQLRREAEELNNKTLCHLKRIVNHWNEFGHEAGIHELIDDAHEYLRNLKQ